MFGWRRRAERMEPDREAELIALRALCQVTFAIAVAQGGRETYDKVRETMVRWAQRDAGVRRAADPARMAVLVEAAIIDVMTATPVEFPEDGPAVIRLD